MIITLKSDSVEVQLLPFGASIYQIKTKNKDGVFKNICLTHKEISDYKNGNPGSMGATCGRVAGRIANGTFTIDGETFALTKNFKEKHTLHGGLLGFNKVEWAHTTSTEGNKSICTFTYDAKHLEEGFPGNVAVKTEYVLEDNTLTVNYYASSDRKTYVNLTNHGYFNLSDDEETIYNHKLYLDSSKFLVADEYKIPTDIKSVDNSEMDFRGNVLFGDLSNKTDENITCNPGIESTYLFDKSNNDYDICLSSEQSGRTVKIKSDYPAVIVYTYNGATTTELLDRANVRHAGVALEPQFAPNAMNDDRLEINVVDVDAPYKHTIRYTFN